MHAAVITVSIEPGREAEALKHLETNVLPAIRQVSGLVAGYWLAAEGGEGMTVLVCESEEAAKGIASNAPNTPRPDFITFGTIEVREVIAQI